MENARKITIEITKLIPNSTFSLGRINTKYYPTLFLQYTPVKWDSEGTEKFSPT